MCTVSVSLPDTSYYENWPGQIQFLEYVSTGMEPKVYYAHIVKYRVFTDYPSRQIQVKTTLNFNVEKTFDFVKTNQHWNLTLFQRWTLTFQRWTLVLFQRWNLTLFQLWNMTLLQRWYMTLFQRWNLTLFQLWNMTLLQRWYMTLFQRNV